MEFVDNLKQKLIQKDEFSFDESFKYSRLCANLLVDKKTERLGRDLIIRVFDQIDRIPDNTINIWNDLLVSAGLYPYVDYERLSSSQLVRLEFHHSTFLPKVFFHAEQLDLLFRLISSKGLIISAPTSFGKSLLIEEIIASRTYNNIVIIQPTLALLDETRKKLQKYHDVYNIVVSTAQEPKDRNIFLFTGERVCEYRLFPQVDFFVIDEFYKLSFSREEGDRVVALNLALYKLLQYTNRFLMLGPHISGISEEFKEKYNANWYYTEFATVAIDLKDYFDNNRDEELKERKLFKLLESLDEPTLVYCSSPSKTLNIASGFYHYLDERGITENRNSELIDWIATNIHDNWLLLKLMRSRIAVHHGGLPRHIASAIVDEFNNGNIKYLFCTSTLIEGVNTSAKNVVFYNKKKGTVPLDYFDYKNIIGRSGRMMKHYIGVVHRFEEQPIERLEVVDIPLIDQGQETPVEMLVHLKKNDIKDSTRSKLSQYESLPEELKVLLKSNVGISIDGQIRMLNDIEENWLNAKDFLRWNQVPSYDELVSTIDLCWKYLKIKKGEEGGIVSAKQLAYFALLYYRHKNLRGVIESCMQSNFKKELEPHEKLQYVINNTLQIVKHWFDYKLPKWLNVVSSIQEYVCNKRGVAPGSYIYFINSIENHFLPSEMTILLDYDVPATTIKKIERFLAGCQTIDEMVSAIRRINFQALGLHPYEIKCLSSIVE